MTCSVRRARWAALAIVAVMLAGCSRPAAPEVPAAAPPTAVVTQPPPPTPTDAPTTEPAVTEEADPYAVPEEIDEAYVERVLDVFGAVDAQIAREVAQRRRVTRTTVTLLKSTRAPEAAADNLRTLRRVIRRQGPDFFSSTAKPADYTVDDLVTATPKCIFVLTTVDSSGLVEDPVSRSIQEYYWLGLATDYGGTTATLNPTPWVVVGARPPRPDGTKYSSPC
jgi:hypothetical protein